MKRQGADTEEVTSSNLVTPTTNDEARDIVSGLFLYQSTIGPPNSPPMFFRERIIGERLQLMAGIGVDLQSLHIYFHSFQTARKMILDQMVF